jgi:hypothetical protein
MTSPAISNGIYVILGATGNTGSIIADYLLLKGKAIRVVGRNAERLQRFVDKGQRLLHLDFSGKQARELLGERDLSMTEATALIERGIGKSDLEYKQLPYDLAEQALTQLGIPPKGAAMYVEMYTAINTGVLVPLEPRSRENTTPTSFETFVQDVFVAEYQQNKGH